MNATTTAIHPSDCHLTQAASADPGCWRRRTFTGAILFLVVRLPMDARYLIMVSSFSSNSWTL
jgi:hypothetical protein